ncbi:hypothetical protein [Steroidobacter sp.]|uniref:hypothetical protein n=1 Tax=Steroidobacter sp. TaxID=1978227 RepID=UPI001A5EABEC|nr:hypothetical protein [Steroidobacter sp.]MBL8271502.1 hypothetical protein [Steroidobacter sp.]
MSGGLSVSTMQGASAHAPPVGSSPLPNQQSSQQVSQQVTPPPSTPAVVISTGIAIATARQIMASGDSNGDAKVNYREFDAAMRQRESLKSMRSGQFASTLGLYASIQMEQLEPVATTFSARA